MKVFSRIFFFFIFLIFAQNVDFGHTLEPPRPEGVLTSTHNLCFGAKIRKNRYTPAYPRSGVQGSVH